MRITNLTLPILAFLINAAPVAAHFQVLLPTTDIVSTPAERELKFDIRFTHPMEAGPVMAMGQPKRFGVVAAGQQQDLTARLQPRLLEGQQAFQATFQAQRPADYVFFIEPAPYWEPAERKMIIHYTKVVVDAYDAGAGWDAAVGLPVEIIPLTRPYGLWTGNLFRGIVMKNGQPEPFAEVEVEYYNVDRAVSIPADPYATQVIRADANGVFAYAMPRAGWWGFAALIDGDRKMANPQGEPVEVELGGLIWIRTRDMSDNPGQSGEQHDH